MRPASVLAPPRPRVSETGVTGSSQYRPPREGPAPAGFSSLRAARSASRQLPVSTQRPAGVGHGASTRPSRRGRFVPQPRSGGSPTLRPMCRSCGGGCARVSFPSPARRPALSIPRSEMFRRVNGALTGPNPLEPGPRAVVASETCLGSPHPWSPFSASTVGGWPSSRAG
jgi:hypothetical protein